jgi:hypothetical protein
MRGLIVAGGMPGEQVLSCSHSLAHVHRSTANEPARQYLPEFFRFEYSALTRMKGRC